MFYNSCCLKIEMLTKSNITKIWTFCWISCRTTRYCIWLNIQILAKPGPRKKLEYLQSMKYQKKYVMDKILECILYILLHHHHHHVVPLARISLTLSRHFSLSFIASGRSSGLHPVSSHSCCMYVRAGRPAFAWPYAGVHRSISLMSSSLLLLQCPACLVRLTCIVFVMVGRWPYSWCLVSCGRQDLFNIARNILV